MLAIGIILMSPRWLPPVYRANIAYLAEQRGQAAPGPEGRGALRHSYRFRLAGKARGDELADPAGYGPPDRAAMM